MDLIVMFEKFNLIELQNHPANVGQDHLSFCAFFDTEEEFAILARCLETNITLEQHI